MAQNAVWSWRSFVTLCAIAACGCSKANSRPVARSEKPATESITTVGVSNNEASEEPSEAAVTPTASQTVTDVKPPVASEALPESKERILLLASSGPVIVDFVLKIEGRPHTEALSRLVEEVLKLADLDGDGRTMWKEICACERIKYGQFGNLPIDGDNAEKQVIDRYDVARDGVVDRFELPRFLTRNAGGSRPFSVRGTLDHRGANRNLAATWQILDEDRDWVIDAAERKTAAARLAAKDTDDDEIITAADINPRPVMPDPERTMVDRRRRGSDAARLLGEHADWLAIQRALEGQYGNGILKGDSSPFPKIVFDELDANHDGRLIHNEFKRLNDVPAQMVIEIAFGHSDEDQASDQEKSRANRERNQPSVKLRRAPTHSHDKSPVIHEPAGRLTISLGDSVLTVATNDTVSQANFAAQSKQALEMFDQNKDGYLERSEIPESLQGQLGRFEAVDADGDGKAYPQEIEAFLSLQQAGLRAQIHARVSDAEDLLFLALDANHDGRLDSREIQRAGERLEELDTNGDGKLTPEELAEVLTVVLARGNIETPDATFAVPEVPAAEKDTKAPRWFKAMDANGDGVISRREFLGTAEQFERLDRDRSGLLEMSEVASGE